MKSLLSSEPMLWFLFLFNLAVAVTVATAAGVDGTQQVLASAAMGAVALGAGTALVLRRKPQD